MSYDVFLYPAPGVDAQDSLAWFNMTSNIGKIFYDHVNGGIPALDGMTSVQALVHIDNFWDKIEQTRIMLWRENTVGEPKLSQLYDSPNGWGSLIGALIWIGRIQSALVANPGCIVRVSA